MTTIQSKISKIDRLLEGQINRATSPTVEDLALVRKNHFAIGLVPIEIKVSREKLIEAWLEVSKGFKYNYLATKKRFKEMRPMNVSPESFERYGILEHLV